MQSKYIDLESKYKKLYQHNLIQNSTDCDHSFITK